MKVYLSEKNVCALVIMQQGWIFVEQNSCAPVITQRGWMLWNKKFLCTCHHMMRVDVVVQKILVDLTCHHVMMVDVLGTKNSSAPVIR
jgi:hypothetical protein